MCDVTGSEDRYVSWVGSISDELEQKGPVAFSRTRLLRQKNLFAHRAALFYTPTEDIPPEYIGVGPLDIVLPVASPDYTEFLELRAYRYPRFWVDLMQRQTHKLRWQPMKPASVRFVRYDYFTISWPNLVCGVKALLDALKYSTSGRGDGKWLYYFGAIQEDARGFVEEKYEQELVSHPKDAKVRVQVSPLTR